MERKLWITDVVNRAFAGPANAILNGLGVSAKDPIHPWTNWMVCEILVVFLIVGLFAALRSRLSLHTPGKLQHMIAQWPAKNGYMGVLPGHAPLVSALDAGLLTYMGSSGGGRGVVKIDGGFVEVLNDHVRILADNAEMAQE
jgi:hypothetical protein